jgi:transcriptional regulator with XRE-family HTH domain
MHAKPSLMKNSSCSFSAIDVGNNIRKWRLSKNYKQGLLAQKLGISRGALSNIENGKTDITISRLCEIAELLGVDAIVFFSASAAA